MLLKRVVWTVLLVLGVCANADARLLLLASQDSGLYRSFQQGLEAGLSSASLDQGMTFTLASDYRPAAQANSGNIIIAAGVEAAKKVASINIGDSRVVYTMLPQSSYKWLRENNLLLEKHQVLFVNQPLYRFVNLTQIAFPSIKTLGFMHGDVSAEHTGNLRQDAARKKIQLNDVSLQPGRHLTKAMDKLMYGSDAVLVLPDPFLFNRRTVQSLLLASLRRKTPLIAYSESYVKAGALLALYSSPEQIGRQTAELVNCLTQGCGVESQKNYPRYFSVQVNNVVARQLGYKLAPASELQRLLELMEARHAE